MDLLAIQYRLRRSVMRSTLSKGNLKTINFELGLISTAVLWQNVYNSTPYPITEVN